jgi:hypothetical protein
MRPIFAFCAGALALSSAANADFVDVVFTGTGAGQTVKISSAARTGSVFAGQLHHTISNGPAALNGDWTTFCTDLAQIVPTSLSQFEVVSITLLPDGAPMGAAKAQAITDMYAYAAGSQLLVSTTNDLATAFQLAIWEVVTDYQIAGPSHNLDITAGGFSATMDNGGALSAGISSHLAQLLGAVGSMGSADLLGIRSGSRQDQILNVVPGPSALAGLVAGFGVVGRRRRR